MRTARERLAADGLYGNFGFEIQEFDGSALRKRSLAESEHQGKLTGASTPPGLIHRIIFD